MLAPLLLLLLSAGVSYTSADGMCQAEFPAAVPDQPGGFLLLHNGNLYSYSLRDWNRSPQQYYENSRFLHMLETPVRFEVVEAGPVAGQEFRSVSREGRHNVLREFAANGFVYKFLVQYSGEEPAEVTDFLESIRFSSRSKDPSRIRLIQCSIRLDGLANTLLDHHVFPADQRCPAGGAYVLQQNGSQFTIYCDGDHGLAPGYPRIDQTRVILEGPEKPLPRPDL